MRIDMTKPLADRDFNDDLDEFNFGGASLDRMGTIDLRKALEAAATDDKIKGLVLYAPGINGGFALGQEARKAITEFKKSGKFVWAYSELLTEGGLYMSSVADEVFISPEGSVEWNGLASEVTFFKNTFDKLDIEPQIFRVGEYKSAVEPFMLDKLSKENREQLNSTLNSVYVSMISDMAPDLGLSHEELLELSANMTVRNPLDAIEHRLISGVMYEDEFEDKVAEQISEEEASDINWVSYRQYNSATSSYNKSKNKVAVIIAEGDIFMAEPQRGLITPAQFVDEIRKARKDESVKAVVLRVNSPGGDALASDLIWREIDLTAKEKPTVASMSNYAASGGYYIAMAADSIVAEPTTLTGSIGIFGIVFNIGDFLANKLGITTDVVATGDYSNYITVSRALTDSEKAIIQNSINKGYENFTAKAAVGRGMSQEQLKTLASGRVWTGAQAVENGLVDALGGLNDAVAMAAEMAGVSDDYKVRYYPVQKTPLEELLASFSGSADTRAMKAKLGDLYPYVDMVEKVKRMNGIQARMPYEIGW